MPRGLRLNVCRDHSPDQQRAADERKQDREENLGGLNAIGEFADRGLIGDLKGREESEGDEHENGQREQRRHEIDERRNGGRGFFSRSKSMSRQPAR